MSWVTSPACTEVETLMLDWMQELLGLPERFRRTSANGGGVIHGSASEATLASILAARWRVTGGDGQRHGDTTKLVAYAPHRRTPASRRVCASPASARRRLRIVAHDDAFAMVPDALAEQIAEDRAAGLVPFWVCATRGTTSTMAFDPTAAIGGSPGARACGCTSTRR